MLKIYSQTYDCKELSRITTLLRWYIVTISHVGCVTHGLTHCKLQTWNERHTPSSSGRIIPDWISSYCLSWKSQLGTSCGIKAHNFLFLRPWKVFAHSLVVIDVTGYQVSTNYKLMMSYCKFTCYCFFLIIKTLFRSCGIFSLSPSLPAVFSSINAAHSFWAAFAILAMF